MYYILHVNNHLSSPINLFERTFVIVPINDNEYWYVVTICFPEQLAQLGGRRQKQGGAGEAGVPGLPAFRQHLEVH